MKKILFIFLLFFIIPVKGQTLIDSTVVEIKKVNSLLISVDTSAVEEINFRENFKESYKDQSFIYEKKSPAETFWDRFVEWFIQWLKSVFDVQDSKKAMTVLDYTINTIAAILIITVIYLIVKAILNKEGTWIFGSKSDTNLIRYDEIERNLHLVDFEKLIKESINSGAHRLSIRYYYLFLLKKMSEKEIIKWDAEKTNSDYIYEIKSPQLKANFEYLSYLYNYIWYGEFDVSLSEFEKAKKAFDSTIQSIY